MNYQLKINDKSFDVTIASISGSLARVLVNGNSYDVQIGPTQNPTVAAPVPAGASTTCSPASQAAALKPSGNSGVAEGEAILAPMPGLILDVKVKVGQVVVAGETVAVMEAMKMENSLTTHVTGSVKEIHVEKGKEVSTGDLILIIG